jgi:hypothetical protein
MGSLKLRVCKLAALFFTFFCSVAYAQISVTGYTQLSSQRVGRTTWNYTYSVQFTNTGSAAFGVNATVVSTVPSTVVVSGSIAIGDMVAGDVATPSSTITIQQDRTVPFSFQNLLWTITAAKTVIGVTEYSSPTDSRLLTINFDNGDTIDLTGSRAPDGTPVALQSTIGHVGANQYEIDYGPDGLPATLRQVGGYTLQLEKTAGRLSAITVSGGSLPSPVTVPYSVENIGDSTLSSLAPLSSTANSQAATALSASGASSIIQNSCPVALKLLSNSCTWSQPLTSNVAGSCAALDAALTLASLYFLPLLPAIPQITAFCVGVLTLEKVACIAGSGPNLDNGTCSIVDAVLPPVQSGTTYSYVGKAMTALYGESAPGPVTGTVVFAQAVPANFTGTVGFAPSATPPNGTNYVISFTLASSGAVTQTCTAPYFQQTISATVIQVVCNESTANNVFTVEPFTFTNGQITAWWLDFGEDFVPCSPPNPNCIAESMYVATIGLPPNASSDIAGNLGTNTQGAGFNVPGTWH